MSTVDDLLAFARMFLRQGDPVLSPDAVALMTTDQLSPSQRTDDVGVFLDRRSWGFCQAVAVEGPRAGSFGWDGGLGTSWLVDPARDMTVIVLTQRLFDDPRPPAVHVALQEAAYGALPGS